MFSYKKVSSNNDYQSANSRKKACAAFIFPKQLVSGYHSIVFQSRLVSSQFAVEGWCNHIPIGHHFISTLTIAGFRNLKNRGASKAYKEKNNSSYNNKPK